MRGARFDPAEVEVERRVIGEERARELNSPQGRLDQTHLALTYIRHPYRNPILGWPEDIAAISVDDLKAFYQAHYRPDGAVLVVVGDVDPEAALDLIASHFADVPAGKTPRAEAVLHRAANRSGRREFVLSDVGVGGRADFSAGARCRGPSRRGCLGRARRSPLLRPAVTALATPWSRPTRRPIWIEARTRGSAAGRAVLHSARSGSGCRLDPIERRIERRARSVCARPGRTADELDRSRRRIKAAWRWEQEDLTSLAAGLGTAALWADWRDWQAEYAPR